MRLRKNMKRTAAAVLALSMAVSAVAAPASAAYICDVSKGNVEISVDESGNKSIKVGGEKVEKSEDESDDIIITGDNTKSTESQNAEEENTSEVEKSGENASEVEKSGETEGEGKTQNSAAEGETEGDEPTSQELLAPEDEEKKDEQKETDQKPAETQETEQDKKTSDQVIEYGQYDPEAQQEATKPVVKQETQEKKAAEEKSYEATNAPISFTEKAQDAARNVVSIFNSSAKALKVILRDLKVDAGDTAQAAMTISGSGNVTLELDGKNKLQSGTSYAGLSKNNGNNGNDGTLTIQDKNGTSGSLESHGGAGGAGIGSDFLKDTSHIVIDSGEITAVGGIGAAGIGGGNEAFPSDNGRGRATDITIAGGTVKAEGGAAGEYVAGGYYVSDTGAGAGIGSGGNYTQTDSKYGDDCYYDITIKGGDVTATAGAGGAAGIGGGSGSGKGKIEIKDSAVISAAEGSGYGAGIGSGFLSLKCNITISGGTIKKALGGAMGGAGIGDGGRALNHNRYDMGTVKITGGSIGEFNYNHKTKKWEWVKGTGAIGQNGGAGIGAGSGSPSIEECNVSITGTVNVAATGGKGGVAIGNGASKDNDKITNTPTQDTFTKDADAVLVKPNEGAGDGLDVTLLTRLPEPAHDHKWTDVGDHHECDVCGKTGSHNWTDNGDGTHKCDECGANENHTWIDNKDGTHTCTGCGTTESMPADTQSVLELWVTDAEGVSLPFAVNQSGSVRTYTSANDTATLTGSMEVLSYLQEHGAETIEFVTNGQTSRFSINDVLAQGSGNDRFYLTHNGSEEATLLVVEADHSEIVYR